ncbi:putative cystathionine gamma-lyase 2 isoform X2 [Planococcus citri]|uniref:putative cystathionine gamma-lyase 2 isoform X2 n=1 Tax=Planococcus citri TaxID=170843 RepID=UPI0031F7561C
MSKPPKQTSYRPLDKHFSTKAIHCMFHPKNVGSKGVIPPINLSTTFHQDNFEQLQYFTYSRFNNPNREMLEKTLATLENGKYACCFSTGMAAIVMICNLVTPGEHILSLEDVYGGTHKYFSQYCPQHKVEVTFADLMVPDILQKNIKPNTKLVWLECLTNPMMRIIDIVTISKTVKKLNPNTLVVVDNSFLSPYLVKVLDLGAHISIGSLTKYIGGHSDLLMGVVVTNDENLHKTFFDYQAGYGATPSTLDCYLALRSVRSLAVRMKQHMCSANEIAKFLQSHPKIEKVLYPGFSTHPRHDLAEKQWSGCSGMLSFYIKGDASDTKKFLSKLKHVSTGLSYGGFESLIEVPMTMSHGATPKEIKEKQGITENFMRLSVGLEDTEDLISDLGQALDSIKK